MNYPEWMRPAWDLEPWMEAIEGRPGTADVRRKPMRHMSEAHRLRYRMAMANPMTRRRMAASAAASAAKGNA